jgi:hypothetical protein
MENEYWKGPDWRAYALVGSLFAVPLIVEEARNYFKREVAEERIKIFKENEDYENEGRFMVGELEGIERNY